MDPFTKSFSFRGDPPSAATASNSALYIIGWMAGREPLALAGEPASRSQSEAGPPKKRRSFMSSLRAFAAEETFREQDRAGQKPTGSLQSIDAHS